MTNERTSGAVGPYAIQRRLGAGGMGVVYLGTDSRLGRQVALKRLPEGQTPSMRERFLREAKALAVLNDPRIVQIFDILEEEGDVWIVMEYVRGRTLSQMIERHALAPTQAVALATQIAAGLAAAHEAGLVHRDLKSSNVIVTEQGSPKILDFGIAKQMQDGSTRLSAVGQVIGTPYAMSPEQARGRPVDARSDLFSLGVLLYQMIAGMPPFRGATKEETVAMILRDTPEPIEAHCPEIAQPLARLIEHLLEKEPGDRPESARAVEALLERVAEGADDAETWIEPRSRVQDPAELPAVQPPSASTATSKRGRHQVTLVALELSGRSRREPADPEMLAEAAVAFQERCRTLAENLGGTVAEAKGHRVLVCFGYPTTFEDNAARAVLTAKHIIEGTASVPADDFGRDLWAKAAVHTGDAVVAGEMDTENIVYGQTLDAVERLLRHAEPGRVLTSAATRGMVEGSFELREDDTSADAHLVVSAREATLQTSIPTLPMVARTRELELMVDRWQIAREGQGQVISISGEPGIGKSRLVAALRDELRGSEATWLTVQGSSHRQASPFFPLIQALRNEPGSAGGDFEALARARGLDADMARGLGSLMATELAGDAGLEVDRELVLDALQAILLGPTGESAAAIVFEDLHWMDPSSLELIGRLVEAASDDPLLLVLTSRPEFEAPWAQRPHMTQLGLQRLTAADTEALIASLAGSGQLGDDARAAIAQATDGVPLFIEELTRSHLEHSAATDGTLSDPTLPIPLTLRDSLAARLDRLGRAREVAQCAATLGREFSEHLLREVSPLAASELDAHLGALVGAGLLRRRRGASPGRLNCTFKHALIRDAAYESLLKGERRAIHERAAHALVRTAEERGSSDPDLIAHHFTEAQLHAEAVPYWQLAGDAALQRSSFLEARIHFDQALRLLQEVQQDDGGPSGEPRDSGWSSRELDLQLGLSQALFVLQPFSPELIASYTRAHELSHLASDRRRIAPVLRGLWTLNLGALDLEACLQLARESLEAARDGDLIDQMSAQLALCNTYCYLAQFDASRVHLDALQELRDQASGNWSGAFERRFGYGLEGQELVWRCQLEWHAGRFDKAAKARRILDDEAERLPPGFSKVLAIDNSIRVPGQRLDPQRLIAKGAALAELARAGEHQGYEGSGILWQALGRALESGSTDAVEEARSAVEDLVRPVPLIMAESWGGVALAQLAAGQFEAALATLEPLLELPFPFELGRLGLLRAEVLLRSGADAASTRIAFDEVRQQAEEQGSRGRATAATLGLARLHAREGDGASAREVLDAVQSENPSVEHTEELALTQRALDATRTAGG